MAKKSSGAAVAIGIAALIGGAAFLFSQSASAGDGGLGGGGDDDPTSYDPTPPPGRGDIPGKGPGGSPKPVDGGDVWGDPPPGASYTIPEDWDPVRGLWISPDCELVVEAPGWWCGSDGDDMPYIYGGSQCNRVEWETYADTMAEPGNGVAGYVDFLLGVGMQPEEIAFQILTEISPMCADVPDDQWPDGLWAWYQALLERCVIAWEEWWGIEFDPELAA